MKRGEVWLVNLNPSRGTEPGKVRPVLVIQSDGLNDQQHPSTVILPLSTRLADDPAAAPLRLRLPARERLESDSEILLDQVRALDNRRFLEGPLTHLTPAELAQVDRRLRAVLGMP
jgi:mRNA interferase MazF